MSNHTSVKRTTTTRLIENYLKESDDFRTVKQIIEATHECYNRVAAGLHHLKKHKVIGMMEADEVTYWYFVPNQDDRSRTVDERAEEEKKRKKRYTKLSIGDTVWDSTGLIDGPLTVFYDFDNGKFEVSKGENRYIVSREMLTKRKPSNGRNRKIAE